MPALLFYRLRADKGRSLAERELRPPAPEQRECRRNPDAPALSPAQFRRLLHLRRRADHGHADPDLRRRLRGRGCRGCGAVGARGTRVRPHTIHHRGPLAPPIACAAICKWHAWLVYYLLRGSYTPAIHEAELHCTATLPGCRLRPKPYMSRSPAVAGRMRGECGRTHSARRGATRTPA